MIEEPGHRNTALAALVSRAERAGKGAPPVESWNPSHCGAIDMRIAEDGSWFYQGSRIDREPLVRLFSTVLRRDPDGHYVLVTPAEKLDIEVEDAPFVAVEMSESFEDGTMRLVFRTNVGDVVAADADHPIRFRNDECGFRPYVLVRGGLEALLTRALVFDLADRLEERDGVAGLASGGAFFPLPPERG